MCSCLKDCPECCNRTWNYFFGLCRDPANPRGSLKHCYPSNGEEAGAEAGDGSLGASAVEEDAAAELGEDGDDVASPVQDPFQCASGLLPQIRFEQAG